MTADSENDAARTEPGALEGAAHELELLRDAAGLIGRSLDLQDIYDSLWRIVSRAMDCDAMFVSSFDPGDELIRCVFAQVEGNRLDPSGFPPIPLEPEGKGTQSRVIRSGEPLVIGDFRAMLRGTTTSFAVSPGGELVDDEAVPEEEGIRSVVIVPITLEGRVIGVTQVQRMRLDAYTSEHRRILGALMDQVAVATTNAHLFTQAKASEERFRLIATVTNDVLWEWDVAGETIRWNEAIESLVGRSSGEIHSFEVWADLVHPEDRDRVVTGLREAVDASADRWSEEYRMRHADGSYRTVFDRGHIVRDASGRAVSVVGAIMDLTERQRLRDELLQAQKMETLGRLAGGVAHDFSNLLNVILVNSEFLTDEIAPGSPSREDLEEIRKAGQRGAALTRQLLAFARRSVVEPEPLDVDEIIVDMDRMLRRLIGAHIELDTLPGARGRRVLADRGQLEQVILNLVVNARDAMPDGGRLTIRSEAISTGQANFVHLSVSDTGVGMEEAIRARVFEPFFTTKAEGKGTGLGLSTAYGIVAGAGGRIEVESAPGAGTTFHVHLPAFETTQVEPTRVATDDQSLLGTETVLVAEDEPPLRGLAERILANLGYRVLAAADGEEGLELAGAHAGPIDLLVSDLMMPRLRGAELARRLRETRPGIRVLFVSGYSDEALDASELAQAGLAFLPKPYTAAELARKVRSVLDAPPVD